MSDVTMELAKEASDKAVEIARLKAENDRMREEFDKMDVWHSKELTAAMADNAKLLELVEDMLDCIQIRAAFSRPPTEEMYEMFYKRARELGVDA